MQFDEITKYIGAFGKQQKWVFFWLCLQGISSGMQSFVVLFTLDIPGHRYGYTGGHMDWTHESGVVA
jgi:hypothetical protein